MKNKSRGTSYIDGDKEMIKVAHKAKTLVARPTS
jgi:hypothetical protein